MHLLSVSKNLFILYVNILFAASLTFIHDTLGGFGVTKGLSSDDISTFLLF
jgi:hypothetical protein